MTAEHLAFVRSCVHVDEDGWCQYPDELVDDVAEAFGLDLDEAADVLFDCIRAIEGGS